MKKVFSVLVLIILLFSLPLQTMAELNYIKNNGLTHFIPWIALESGYSASEWMASDETRARFAAAITYEFSLIQLDAKEIEFETNLQQLIYIGRDGDSLNLDVLSNDGKRILYCHFDVPEQVAVVAVIHCAKPESKEKLEQSVKKNSPDGYYEINNTILEVVYAQYLEIKPS